MAPTVCRACDGTGVLLDDVCPLCDGPRAWQALDSVGSCTVRVVQPGGAVHSLSVHRADSLEDLYKKIGDFLGISGDEELSLVFGDQLLPRDFSITLESISIYDSNEVTAIRSRVLRPRIFQRTVQRVAGRKAEERLLVDADGTCFFVSQTVTDGSWTYECKPTYHCDAMVGTSLLSNTSMQFHWDLHANWKYSLCSDLSSFFPYEADASWEAGNPATFIDEDEIGNLKEIMISKVGHDGSFSDELLHNEWHEFDKQLVQETISGGEEKKSKIGGLPVSEPRLSR